jgi:hypothetical protein
VTHGAGSKHAYVCENCGRLGPIRSFDNECRPGWSHGRLIQVKSAPEIDRLRERAAFFEDSANRYHAALCNLWRAITEDDMSDHDEARIHDALAEAQRLAPYEPTEPDENGF